MHGMGGDVTKSSGAFLVSCDNHDVTAHDMMERNTTSCYDEIISVVSETNAEHAARLDEE